MPSRHFGTDGIRGRVGTAPMTPGFVRRLGRAAARTLARNGRPPTVLIGGDTRESGPALAGALAAGLADAGARAELCGILPTPAVAWLVGRDDAADAGAVVSASHNPYRDNGVKLLGADGGKLPDAAEAAIEAALEAETDGPPAAPAPLRDEAARLGAYLAFCRAAAPALDLSGRHFLIDCAHGAAHAAAPRLFRELGARVTAVGAAPDGRNINAGCGATCPEYAQAETRACGAELGLSLDGDGDRLMMIDEDGAVADGDDLLLVLARARQAAGALDGGVVGTEMSNRGLERALAERGIPFARAAVGDRHVLAMLRARGWQLGGETSGHVICRELAPGGDGLLTALQTLAALAVLGQTLAAARADLRKHPQVMVNVPRSGEDAAGGAVEAAVAGARAQLGARGRVLVRPSGTEPLLRIMVESEDAGEAGRLARAIAAAAGAESL